MLKSSKSCKVLDCVCFVLTCGKGKHFVRGFHTFLCLAVPGALLWNDNSDLHHWLVSGTGSYILGVVYLCLLLSSLFFYYTACLVDPGFVPIPNAGLENEPDAGRLLPTDSDRQSLLPDGATPDGTANSMQRICWSCRIKQPLRSKHCSDCGRCVRKFDHHCPWLSTCVGEGNHKFFWLFLALTLSLILWTAIIAWKALPGSPLSKSPSASAGSLTGPDYFAQLGVCVGSLLVLLVGGLSVVSLFCLHTYLVLTNQTSWESMARSKITYLRRLPYAKNPFNLGCCANLYTFFCYCSPYSWDRIYQKVVADGDDGSLGDRDDEEDGALSDRPGTSLV